MTSVVPPRPSDDADLARYLRRINAFPMLSRDDEYMLARRWREHRDTEAAHRLVTSHLRLVARIAGRYRGYGLPMADLISEGNLGLMRALQRFDPERGFRLATYAMWWVRAAVLDFILRSWSLVSIGSAALQKRLFFGLRRAKARLNILDGGTLSPDDAAALSEALDVPAEQLIEVDRRMAAPVLSLDAQAGRAYDGEELVDTLTAETPTPEEAAAEHEEDRLRREITRSALDALSPRDRHIFVERRLTEEPKTLAELSRIHGVSRERIRQIEDRAFGKVRAAVLDNIPRHAVPI